MWFGSLFAPANEPSRRRADCQTVDRRLAARRLLLEPLEDRVVLTFAAPTIYPVSSSPSSLAAADFTGDGILDLATQGGVLVGNGDGSFQPRWSPVPGGLAGDVDGNGTADLIVAGGDNMYVSISNGDGTFQPAQPVTLPLATPPGYDEPLPQSIDSAVVGDLNADGLLDLVVTGTTVHEVSSGPYGEYGSAINKFANVLIGTGLGTFDATTHYLGFGGGTYFLARTDFSPPELGDFNGDGNLDLLLSQVEVYWSGGGLNSYSALSVWLGNGDGTLQPAQVTSTYPGPHFFQLPADFNQDGRTDVLIEGEGYGTRTVALANANGTFNLMSPFPIDDWFVGSDAGDVNGDGKLDLVFVKKHPFENGSADVFLGSGNGTFSAPVTYSLGSYDYASPTLADFDGDGLADLAAVDRNAGVIVHMNTGDGSPPPPELRIVDASVAEGNSGTTNMTFTVTLTHAATVPVTLQYATANGTAASGSDYQPASGTLVISAGQTTGTITIPVNGDATPEGDETFYINLSSADGATIADGQGVGTIVNDDVALSSLTIGDVSKKEGKGGTTAFSFTVTLSASSNVPVTVQYMTADGTATFAGEDYTAKVGTLTFQPGQTSQTITISVKGDKTKEADETFFVNLFGVTNAQIADGQGKGTILNDDTGITGGKRTVSAAAAYDHAIAELMFTSFQKRKR
jgi:hypothetical protein